MKPEQAMQVYLSECTLHAEVLAESLSDIAKYLPFSADTVLSKELLRILDQIAYRFTKLQDSMGEKVLPLILVLAQEPISSNATFVEKLNRLERIGALLSAEEWKQLRVARNAIAHEYPDEPELRASALNHFVKSTEQLKSLYLSVRQYVTSTFPSVTKT